VPVARDDFLRGLGFEPVFTCRLLTFMKRGACDPVERAGFDYHFTKPAGSVALAAVVAQLAK